MYHRIYYSVYYLEETLYIKAQFSGNIAPRKEKQINFAVLFSHRDLKEMFC